MRRAFFLAAVLSVATSALAGSFEVGMRHVAMVPLASGEYESGDLDIGLARGFAASAAWFPTERTSYVLSGTWVNPEAILFPSSGNPPDLDLDTLQLDVYSLQIRRHFRTRARLAPYVAAGPALVVTRDLKDRFADDIEAAIGDTVTASVELGLRYRVRPRLTVDFALSWMPLEPELEVLRNADPRITLPESIPLDPATVSLGANWRF